MESDLKGLSDEELQAHLDRVGDYFEKATYQANGTVSYYYRIDPAVSQNVKGFWRVNLDGEGFKEYEPTDISSYDVQDTSQLVWFTVPKNTGEPVWLPPYVTDNLDVRVISYNTPVYLNGRFVGVIGIELDYSFMAEQVNNLTLYDGGYAFVNDSQGNLVYHPRMNESCYGIWSAEQKCLNCSSAMACRTGRRQEKAERFRDDVYFIQLNPVKLRLPDGDVFDAVVELVSVEKEASFGANDREAENIGDRAAHYLSHHDSLTNVLLANTFYELAREVIKNNPETSWVMITCNIMNFRLVNTLFGDTRGNDVLVRTASALREIAEGASGLCGRLGGDQFALLIPGDRYEERPLIDAAQMLAGTFSSGLYAFCIHFGVYEVDDSSVPVSVMCGRANSALRTIREDMTRTVAYFDDAIRQKLLLEHEVISSFASCRRWAAAFSRGTISPSPSRSMSSRRSTPWSSSRPCSDGRRLLFIASLAPHG